MVQGNWLLRISLLLSLSCVILAQDDDPPSSNKKDIQPPSIVRQPPQNIVVDGREEEYTLDCVATGEPVPTYKWKKDGVEVSNNAQYKVEDGTLTFLQADYPKFYDGVYQCFATNSEGTALSSKITAKGSYLKRFELDSAGAGVYTFQLNTGAKLPCTPPDGVPKPRVFWSKKLPESLQLSDRVNEDPLGNLIFSNVNQADTAQYFCNAIQDGFGEMKQSPVYNVTITTTIPAMPRAPQMMYTPDNVVTVLRGEEMLLKCLAQGYPTPAITWERLDADFPADRVSIESYDQTVKVKNLEYSDEGRYKCTATNNQGSTSKEVRVKVEAKPFWDELPEDRTTPPGTDVTLECKVEGIPQPAVTWLRSGEEITDSNSRRTIRDGTLTFVNAQLQDTNVYQCVAKNDHGEIMRSLYLNVLAVPAKIISPPPAETLTVVDGTAKITCEAFGSPAPTVQWKFKNNVVTGDRYDIWKNGTLVISDITKADEGDYTCLANNGFAEPEATGRLTVRRKTTIDEKPQDTFTKEGTDAQFECSATADANLELQIHWEKGGERLLISHASRYSVDPDTSALTIRRPQLIDTNDYTCVASTSLDEARASAKLTVQNVPNAPAGLRANEGADEMNYILHWTEPENNNAPITGYIVEYATEFDSFGIWKELDTVGTQTSAEMELSPWVVYKFRVIAVNEIGNSNPSDEYGTITTVARAPSENPKDFKGTPDTPYGMLISWKAMEPETHNGKNFVYNLKYRKTGEADWTPVVIADWETTSYRVETDKPFTEFEISMQTSNSVGSGPDPLEAIAYSGEKAPEGKPENVKLTVKGPKEFEVSWDDPPKDTINGMIVEYQILYSSVSRAEPRQRRAAEVQTKVVNKSPGILDNLTPFSTYTIQVAVTNSMGDGPPSDAVVEETPEGVPGVVSDYELIPLSGAFYLRWGYPEAPNGEVRGYGISYAKMHGSELGNEEKFNITDPEIFKKKIGGLGEEEEYRIKIWAYTRQGEGETITKEETTRPLAPPNAPDKPVIVLAGDSSMNVTWTTDEQGPSVDEYNVYHRKEGSGEDGWQEPATVDPLKQTWYELTGLDSGTSYDIQVYAVNMQGTAKSPITTGSTSGAGALQESDSFVTAPWFIGLMVVIVFLLIILLIICLIKRNKGGKYHVSEKEDQLHGDIESDPRKDDDGGFGEYKGKDSPDETEPLKKPETGSHRSSKVGSETDSMAEYGDGGDTGQFNEDGSFIGQYGDEERKRKQQDQAAEGDPSSPAAFSTFV